MQLAEAGIEDVMDQVAKRTLPLISNETFIVNGIATGTIKDNDVIIGSYSVDIKFIGTVDDVSPHQHHYEIQSTGRIANGNAVSIQRQGFYKVAAGTT